jgi:Uncharacterised nucleotidyltransferase
MSRDAMLLVHALRDPASTRTLDAEGWTALIAMARAEQLIGTLAYRLKIESVPAKVAEILSDARTNAEYQRRSALWEADCARRALADYPGKIVLLKGTAYVAAGLKAGQGRHIGDLDIMVARDDLPQVEAALLDKGGWEWVKEDAYDDAYYRDHMHELPPLIHKDRDRMIDVHHTILPLTAGPKPDAEGMLADAIALSDGLYILSPPDMVIHSAAHLFADGDLAGGLRNLRDIHCLIIEFGSEERFFQDLCWNAANHQLTSVVSRALRLAARLYGTRTGTYAEYWTSAGGLLFGRNEKPGRQLEARISDRFFIRRLTARDGWGRPTRKFTRLIFYIRSHWLRMPPLMLARHLFTKWRKAKTKS